MAAVSSEFAAECAAEAVRLGRSVISIAKSRGMALSDVMRAMPIFSEAVFAATAAAAAAREAAIPPARAAARARHIERFGSPCWRRERD